MGKRVTEIHYAKISNKYRSFWLDKQLFNVWWTVCCEYLTISNSSINVSQFRIRYWVRKFRWKQVRAEERKIELSNGKNSSTQKQILYTLCVETPVVFDCCFCNLPELFGRKKQREKKNPFKITGKKSKTKTAYK